MRILQYCAASTTTGWKEMTQKKYLQRNLDISKASEAPIHGQITTTSAEISALL